ncbi:MAG: 50S ribosomal protein L10 [Christensenellales bacterium]|jgi:ribosomal protein L10
MSAETIKLKEQQVAEYVEKFGKAKSVVLVDYRGLNVAEDTLMRNDLRKANVEYKVIKNRLVLRAFNNAGIAGFDTVLEGPTAMAISYDDAVAPAKIIVDNVKKTNKLTVKGGIVEGKVLDAKEITKVAAIPAKPVLVAQLLGMLQTPVRGLAVALSEIAKKKEA